MHIALKRVGQCIVHNLSDVQRIIHVRKIDRCSPLRVWFCHFAPRTVDLLPPANPFTNLAKARRGGSRLNRPDFIWDLEVERRVGV